MPIFKFTTVKPSALKIWTTLIDTPIHPREGYTEDQIRYRMFICLQLATNFKITVSNCNNIIDADSYPLTSILTLSCTLASCTESDFSDLKVLSLSFPHWVSPELYVPYYLTKMLCGKIDKYDLMNSLFDRQGMLTNEITHMDIDIGFGKTKGLTAYKLYNSMHMNEMLPYVTISYNRTPWILTHGKQEIVDRIRDQLLDSIEVSDNYIISDGAKITIPYFVFKTVPQTRSSSSTRPFAVGDRVQLRSNLEVNKGYGGMTFMDAMKFSVVATIGDTNNDGDIKVKGMSFWYSSEMLEHVKGGTDASQ